MPCRPPICCQATEQTPTGPTVVATRRINFCDEHGNPINYAIAPTCRMFGAGFVRVPCDERTTNPPPAPPSPTGCDYLWMCLNDWARAGYKPGRVLDRFCRGPKPARCQNRENNTAVCVAQCTTQRGYSPPSSPRTSLTGRTLPSPNYLPLNTRRPFPQNRYPVV